MIGGDFNIMRAPEDKSSGEFDPKWPNLFNVVIESLDLKEFVMSGHQYTWAGAGDNPTFEKLDRVLVNTEWEDQFPLTTVEPRERNISDHTPSCLTQEHRLTKPKTDLSNLRGVGLYGIIL
jgi:endonuclease/exonuclease/phosphatase family metal-dependent hydrolase